jgi:hypothetical protein
LNRREFQKLSAAALGGLIAGTVAGCNQSNAPAPTVASIGDKHVCRGLNSCKGLGADGKNDCAGQGNCATIKHDCAGKNQCKGQGGCSPKPAANDCAGKGGCAMPVMASAWKEVRQRFEADMAAKGKKVGAAPKG